MGVEIRRSHNAPPVQHHQQLRLNTCASVKHALQCKGIVKVDPAICPSNPLYRVLSTDHPPLSRLHRASPI